MTYHKQVTSTNVNSQEEGLFKSLVPVIRGKYVSCEQSHIKGKSDFLCVFIWYYMHPSDGENTLVHKDFLTYNMFLPWGGAKYRGMGGPGCEFWTRETQGRHSQIWRDENLHVNSS